MSTEPATKRAIAFIDGQNLFHAVKNAFGYTYPNYNVQLLAQAICNQEGWSLSQTRFYTGVPEARDNTVWHGFWQLKLGAMRRLRHIHVFSRSLKYQNKELTYPDGSKCTVPVGQEKGIDVRIAIDIIALAFHDKYDVALVFSQDQDLSETATELRVIARSQNRWIKIASAFPNNNVKKHLNNKGIKNTDWKPFEKSLYDACLDPADYRRPIVP